jgi:hypothetical protein
MKSEEMESSDCARFLQGYPIYAENTHAEFSKSPMEWFFMPKSSLKLCLNCAHGKKITSQKANKSQLSANLRLDISICK